MTALVGSIAGKFGANGESRAHRSALGWPAIGAAAHPGPVVVIHGGAGAGEGLGEDEQRCRSALKRALGAARSALDDGGDAVQAVQAAVRVLERCELFNAGRGAALCSDGSVELSASLMRGCDRGAGAVGGLRRTMHPIDAARAVLDSDQVLLIGEHADAFAAAAGAEQVANSYFVTERRLRALAVPQTAERHGTVGAVCLDAAGGLAAATSTGGISGQPPGRVGDSPLIGAGTWADPRVAVSCTGDGEAFVRAGAARQLACLMQEGAVLDGACGEVLSDVRRIGGSGGLIAVDARGQVSLPFTTAVMPRGVWRHGGDTTVWVADT